MTPGITGRTRLYGLVGHPVRHSLSPAMHNELFRRKRIDSIYAAFDVPPGAAGSVAGAIRTLGLAGVNLTVPFKEAVLPDLDACSADARLAGAVNVVIREEGALVGHNTDGIGYLRALREELGVEPAGARVAILGAGGTARAVAAALATAGAMSVTFLNRTQARAVAACEALGAGLEGRFPCRFAEVGLTPAAWSALAPGLDLVVNCTSGGAAATVASLDIRGLRPGSTWTDANYWMSDPPQLMQCAGRGVRIQRGMGMLVYQGAESFRLFTDVTVDADTVRGVLDLGGW